MPEKPPAIIAPYPLAMVVCDAIWQDPTTGKKTILGTFSSLGAPNFPVLHPVLGVYVVLADGRGVVPVVLRLVDVDDETEPLAELTQEVDFKNPRVNVELCFQIGNLVFPHEGEYRFQLYAASEFLLERRILVQKIEVPGSQQDGSEPERN
jgi:hypothetical protein